MSNKTIYVTICFAFKVSHSHFGHFKRTKKKKKKPHTLNAAFFVPMKGMHPCLKYLEMWGSPFGCRLTPGFNPRTAPWKVLVCYTCKSKSLTKQIQVPFPQPTPVLSFSLDSPHPSETLCNWARTHASTVLWVT